MSLPHRPHPTKNCLGSYGQKKTPCVFHSFSICQSCCHSIFALTCLGLVNHPIPTATKVPNQKLGLITSFSPPFSPSLFWTQPRNSCHSASQVGTFPAHTTGIPPSPCTHALKAHLVTKSTSRQTKHLIMKFYLRIVHQIQTISILFLLEGGWWLLAQTQRRDHPGRAFLPPFW